MTTLTRKAGMGKTILAVTLIALDALCITAALNALIRQDFSGWIGFCFVIAVIIAVLTLIIVRMLKKMINSGNAWNIALKLATVEEKKMSFDELGKLTFPIKNAPRKIEMYVSMGYLRDLKADFSKQEVRFLDYADDTHFMAVKCPSCGAHVSVEVGKTAPCAYCGTVVDANKD